MDEFGEEHLAEAGCRRLFRGMTLMSVRPHGCLGCLSYGTNEGERWMRRELRDDMQPVAELRKIS